MLKRTFDLTFAILGLLVLSPLFLIIGLAIALDSKGGIFYLQTRIGKNEQAFQIFKFRTMRLHSDKGSLITIGGRDPRITKVGYFLRKYKLDELPQLMNVVNNTMSFVGPRPEVLKYVKIYNENQKKVLTVKPGITDYASLKYKDENELLGKAEHPEKLYTDEIMPEKLKLNLKYIESQSFLTDLKIIFKTVSKILFSS